MKNLPRPKSLKAILFAAPLVVTLAACGAGEPQDPAVYIKSAEELLQNNDVSGAEIQLRNALRAAPRNADIHLRLAAVYMKMNDPIAAEAHVIAANQAGATDDQTDPLLAATLYGQGKLGDLLKDLPPRNRPDAAEATVRAYRGISEAALGHVDVAETMVADAERLAPDSVDVRLARAQVLISKMDYSGASTAFDEAARANPNDDRILEQKGRLLAATGQRLAARQAFEAAKALNKFNSRASTGLATIKIVDGDLDGALADLDAVPRTTRPSAMATYLRAEIAARKQEFQAADVVLNQLRGVMEQLPQAFLLGGAVKYQLGQFDTAVEYLEKYIARRTDIPAPYEILGLIALRRGEGERAVAMLEQAVKLAPDNADLKSRLSQAYFLKGDTDRSLGLLNEAVGESPENAELKTDLAVTRLRTGDADALSDLTALFHEGTGSVRAGPPLIVAALRTGHTSDAAAAAEALVKAEPTNVLYQGLLGSVRMAQRDMPAAEKIFVAMLQKQPDLAAARNSLAQVYLATNRTAEAKRIYEDRLAKVPTDLPSLSALARLLVAEKSYDQAIQRLTQAQQMMAADPTPGLQIVSIYTLEKNWPDAIKQARVVFSAFPRDERVIDMLGRTFSQSGDNVNALATYRQGIASIPRSAFLHANYAAALAAAKDETAALAALTRASELAPQNQPLKAQLIDLTFRVKGADAALALAKSLRTADSPLSDLSTAEILDKTGQYAAAIAFLDQVLQTAPTVPALLKKAELQQRHGDTPAAIATLEGWIKTKPDDIQPRLVVAQLYGQARNYDAAIGHFEKLAAERPQDPVVLNDLAWHYLQKKDPRAQATAEAAYRYGSELPQVADTYGWVLTVQGDATNGSKYLQTASAALPNVLEVQYHYAVALSQTNRAPEARVLLQKILQTNTAFEGQAAAKQLYDRLARP